MKYFTVHLVLFGFDACHSFLDFSFIACDTVSIFLRPHVPRLFRQEGEGRTLGGDGRISSFTHSALIVVHGETMLMLVLVRVCHSVYRRASVRREPRAAFYVCKEASLPFYQ